jgi:HAMP domain-containing protein
MRSAGDDPDGTVVRKRHVPRDAEGTVVRAPAPGAGLLPGVAGPPGPPRPPVADELITIVNPSRTVGPAGPGAGAAAPAGTAGLPPLGPVPPGLLAPGLDLPSSAPGTVLDMGQTLRPLARQSPALRKGMRLHEYRIERVLGQGGFGITYLATDANLHAQVAIKEYLPEAIAFRARDGSVLPNSSRHRDRYQQGLESFLAEARTLATFRHPNIVRVARFFEANRTAYMVLEYERGTSFKQWWPQQNRNDGRGERLLARRLQPLLDGLSAVHAAGYLHRDIKPDNIQVRDDDGRLVLLDFGSAGQAVALPDQDTVVVTPGYAPLEQYGLGEQGVWTDLYAMGGTLYWAVTGNKPPDAEDRAAGAAMPSAVQLGQGQFGTAFLEGIDWALQMDPAARPASVEAWRDKLLADHASGLGLRDALRRQDRLRAGNDAAARLSARLGRWWHRALSPADWSLKVKVAAVLLLTALAPMLLTGLYNVSGAKQALQDTQLRNTELLARSSAARVGQLLDDNRRQARFVARQADLAAWLQAPNEIGLAPLQQLLAGVAASHPDLLSVSVMDTAGGVRLSTDPDLVGRHFGQREYFREAMAGRAFATGVVVGASAGAAGVFLAEPVRDAAGAVAGVAVLHVRAAAFSAILAQGSGGSELTPFMVDGDGVVMDHPKPEALYRSLVPLDPAVQQRIKADQRFRRDRIQSINEPALAAGMLASKRGGSATYRSNLSGQDEIAGFAPVPGHNWTVVVSQTREAFEAPVRRLMLHLQISLALVGLLFAGLALRFARGIVQPVQQLTDSADALKAGHFDRAYVETRRRDELGRLARTFNVMVDVLRQREREQDRGHGAGPRP